ncbi:leucyl aminopeptidase [Xinfangfangia sp. D13-10-4-6]|uniref:leucyl aminopeptidase n=1 Tax=Pseudogemmobacter hezensis TaxID=2737662 RepID=UPI00155635D0|nr:leucyl aminopeptidase [Pseudogemmobacter hezensis]NPD15846.1 leucyl aminopeptidase [Pseudogemmobacter hezensis]
MSQPVQIRFEEAQEADLTALTGQIAIFADAAAPLSPLARKLDRAAKGAFSRAVASDAFAKLKPGEGLELAFPAGLAADAVQILRLPKRTDTQAARKAGAVIGAAHRSQPLTVLAEGHPKSAEIAFGLAIRAYEFEIYRSGEKKPWGPVAFRVTKPEEVAASAAPLAALAEGVFFTRDLINEPANVLTTFEFAARLAAMQELGLDVEILEEEELERLGMRALLGVGQGSESPSKVVVMQWRGGAKDEAPLALIGKGVCFDTGGISLKPAAGMEDMVMDMGGAGTVAGVMRTLALRKAKTNVVGIVGLVENMPDGRAQRPGDVVKSMKGDTIEVINTDAEGRLVLADVLWYAQERFSPRGMIDLATLTGAVIVALGNENAGVFSNDDTLCNAFLKAAEAEAEGAWRLPLGDAYDAMLKSRVADMRNSCGREAGSITAAQFLQRFVKADMPWIHLDIAGTAWAKSGTAFSPKGATGWGVRALNRLIQDRFEG